MDKFSVSRIKTMALFSVQIGQDKDKRLYAPTDLHAGQHLSYDGIGLFAIRQGCKLFDYCFHCDTRYMPQYAANIDP